jgi:hypothetical protein
MSRNWQRNAGVLGSAWLRPRRGQQKRSLLADVGYGY